MFELFSKKNGNLKDDVLSGVTVALLLVPEAIAFSFIAGVNPMVGLWSAVFVGFITAAFGGRPGMICGATGAIAIVAAQAFTLGKKAGLDAIKQGTDMAGLTPDDLGLQYLVAALLFAGAFQITIGLFKLGRFIRLIPHPVMMGFVNGLAIVIALGQLLFFKSEVSFDDSGNMVSTWLSPESIGIMVALIALTMSIIVLLPRVTKAVPPTLVAIIAVFGVTMFLDGSRDIKDILVMLTGKAEIDSSLPGFTNLSAVPWGEQSFYIAIIPISLTIALVGLIESLLTLQLIDEITETRGQGNRECVAQGAANIMSGMFGGMGGCATIGQSLINMKNGGRGRTSGMVGAITLLLLIMFGADIIMSIPVAALVGVMFMIVISTFEWSTFKTIGKVANSELLVILAVTLVTVFLHNLALAVLVGVILSALVFAWESSKHVTVTLLTDEPEERVYGVSGMIYFGSVHEFSEKFQAKSDVKNIVIDFEEARICDLSGLEAVNALGNRYENAGKHLRVRHLSADCRRMLKKAGTLVNIEVLPDDPNYSVARLRSDDSKIIGS
ncbi:SulP family inorganic anion transporter [Verrucomicrobiaceae bacterium R5-34]|uniref:SulP family inorganic anion transporter n=1 Tax=Oceaniferula flava TaxID=2800421 RepID=A0AAE2SB95_9BACT|nr:SulP family inorganic anion transporter [Oceaniferula flavus]MBK1831370.1 SulP family inorganic anion transporter [Verrucomicrobiaceae bacterium R5-34]MBK1854960.1 SulP family inorganic anion transporter [Oceaniferula flavus]MBM1136266.1 SulP family inorganic anion transporter [Oceaniferula flavus]